LFDETFKVSYVCWEFKTQLIMKKVITIICFVFISNFLFGQQHYVEVKKMKPNSIYFELGGNGIKYSVNYDRVLIRQGWVRPSIRVGYATWTNNTRRTVLAPLEGNILIGKAADFLELGVGKTLGLDFNDNGPHFFRIGYRYQGNKTPIMARFAVLPIIDPNNIELLPVWLAWSLGFRF
jgi:hypothetical protein